MTRLPADLPLKQRPLKREQPALPARLCFGLLALLIGLSGCVGIPAGSPFVPPSAATAAPAPTLAPAPTGSPVPAPSSTASPAPLPTDPPAAACNLLRGKIELLNVESPTLGKPVEVRLYLPPCYAVETERRYPVIYLLHGQSAAADQWDRLGADEFVDQQITTWQIEPFIMVMPFETHWDSPDETTYGQALTADVLPYIDRTYRTLPEAAYRAIGGISRGGSWALHLGLQHPELFGTIGLHSAPVFISDAEEIESWLDGIPPASLPRLFLDIGESDVQAFSSLWLKEILNRKGIPHEYYVFPGYHNEDYWQAHLPDYLRWYIAGW